MTGIAWERWIFGGTEVQLRGFGAALGAALALVAAESFKSFNLFP